MSNLDDMASVTKALEDLRKAATTVCVLSHILETRDPGKKTYLETMRSCSYSILDALDALEGHK